MSKKTQKSIIKIISGPVNPYEQKNESELVRDAEILIERLQLLYQKSSNIEEIAEVERQLHLLRAAAVKKTKDVESTYSFYPDIDDHDFNSKLLKKVEFAKNKQEDLYDYSQTYDIISNNLCGRTGMFKLSNNQTFLKNFLSPKSPYKSILLYHGVGVGKCHGKGTPIMMYDGTTKLVEDIEIGDFLMGDDGFKRRVLALGTGMDNLYKIIPTEGSSQTFTVNSEHILCLIFLGGFVHKNSASTFDVHFFNNNTITVVAQYSNLSEAEECLCSLRSSTIFEMSVVDYINIDYDLAVQFALYRAYIDKFNNDTKIVVDDMFLYVCATNVFETEETSELEKIKYLSSYEKKVFIKHLVTYNNKEVVHSKYQISIKIESRHVLELVLFIARSIGINAYNDDECKRLIMYGRQLEYILHNKLNYITTYLDTCSHFRVEFLKFGEYYGFTLDSNHRYLLGDFTVTHNTCTALTIAENFRSLYNKKVLIILPSSIKEGFKKQIFDVSKTVSDMSGTNQCIAKNYLEAIPDRMQLGKELLDKRMQKLINENFQFMGFLEFANTIIRMETDIKRLEKRPSYVEVKLKQQLRETFSNRVIIIDEVHNTRADTAPGSDAKKNQKLIPPLLMKVIENVDNTKLILCSATPMFNDAKEITWILNLLLAHEKKPQLKHEQLFDKIGNLTDKGRLQLVNSSRGIVSYMRGENPFTFPQRLYPSINDDPKRFAKSQYPTIDIYGKSIPKDKRLRDLEIIKSPMSPYQSAMYKGADATKLQDSEEDIDDDAYEDDMTSSHVSKHIQLSNIAFPSTDHTGAVFGKNAFFKVFDKIDTSTNLRVKYNSAIIDKFGEFMSPNYVGMYSSKIKSIIDYIKASNGIVFVYSYYIYSALLPLAIALEHIGYNRYGTENILQKKAQKDVPKGSKKLSYSILARDPTICNDLGKEIEAITSEANVNGEVVKVILGTSVSAEGIDFKRIREVHIFEPWYHLNRIEQVIGRSVRTCSHSKLEKENRNVTIYHHAAVPNDYKTQESIDLRIYRIAEQKQIAIKQVEKILKSNAIDCILNRPTSFYDPKLMNIRVNMRTSQGTLKPNFLIGDQDGQSNYEQIDCMSNLTDIGVDSSTFESSFYLDDMLEYLEAIRFIANSYAEAFTYHDISEFVNRRVKRFDHNVLKYTLNEVIRQKLVLKSAADIEGRFIYNGLKYLFVPIDNPFSYITSTNRKRYKPYQSKRILMVEPADNSKDIELQHENKPTDMINYMKEQINSVNTDIRNALDLENSKDFTAIIDYIIDRLERDTLLKLCQFIILNKDLQDILIQAIYKSLLQAGILVVAKNSTTFTRLPQSPSDIYVLDKTKQLVKGSVLDLNEFHRSKEFDHVYLTYSDKEKDMKQYRGYMEVVNNVSMFKMIGEKKNSSGCVCEKTSTIRVDDLKNALTQWRPNILDNNNFKKVHLCKLYELCLRIYAKDNFLRPFAAFLMKTK